MNEAQRSAANAHLRYAVDETPSEGLTIGLSLQVVALVLTAIILVPIIVLNAANHPEGVEWAVFAALLVSGLSTILQARPTGPVGAGYPLYEKGLIVCISFWAGLGFQFGLIFPDHLPEWSRGVLDNGMASGGIVAMAFTLLVSLGRRGQHDVLEPTVRSLRKLRAALDRAAERAGWDEVATNRLELAGEEAFLYLLERQAESEVFPIRVTVRPVDDLLQIELVSGPDNANLETRLERLGEEHEEQAVVRDVGPRILRHVAKEVRHEQFYDLDVVTVTVDTRPLV